MTTCAKTPDVISVKTGGEAMLYLVFANGEHKQFSMKHLLTIKPWQRLNDPQKFRQARACHGTVVWDEQTDIAPETLYLDSLPMSAAER